MLNDTKRVCQVLENQFAETKARRRENKLRGSISLTETMNLREVNLSGSRSFCLLKIKSRIGMFRRK